MIDSKGIEIKAGMNVLFDGEVWELWHIQDYRFILNRFDAELGLIDMELSCQILPQLQAVEVAYELERIEWMDRLIKKLVIPAVVLGAFSE